MQVEGAELHILECFPFNEYCVRFATVETNDDAPKEQQLRSYMRGKGFAFVGHAAHDDFFAWSPATHDGSSVNGTPKGVLPFDPPMDYVDEALTASAILR